MCLGRLKVVDLGSTVATHGHTSWLLLLCTVVIWVQQWILGQDSGAAHPSYPNSSLSYDEHENIFYRCVQQWILVRDSREADTLDPNSWAPILPYKHTLYQWISCFLLMQALLFRSPHLSSCLARDLPANVARLKFLYSQPCAGETESAFYFALTVNKRLNTLFRKWCYFDFFQGWALCDFFGEICCAGNLAVQVFLANVYLGGEFLGLGWELFDLSSEARQNIFSEYCQCELHTGPHGIPAVCSLPLNPTYSLLFLGLALWCSYLALRHARALLSRLLILCLHSRVTCIDQFLLSQLCPRFQLCPATTKGFTYADWWFMCYVAENLRGAGRRRFLEAFSAWLTETSLEVS